MLSRFNDWLADMMAEYLSSMSCFWIITSLVVVVLFWQRPASLVGWITYISTAIFQASALPILGFVSKKSGAKTERLLQETHDQVMGHLTTMLQHMEKVLIHVEVEDERIRMQEKKDNILTARIMAEVMRLEKQTRVSIQETTIGK